MGKRLVFLFAAMALGWLTGGEAGVIAAVVFCALLGAFFPAPADPMNERDNENMIYDEIRPARRGREVDPTRPQPEDYKAMHEVRAETK